MSEELPDRAAVFLGDAGFTWRWDAGRLQLDVERDDIQAALARAELHSDAGDAKQALLILDRALEQAPTHADAWSVKGRVLFGSNYAAARACYERALALDPQLPYAWLNHALTLINEYSLLGSMPTGGDDIYEAAFRSLERAGQLGAEKAESIYHVLHEFWSAGRRA